MKWTAQLRLTTNTRAGETFWGRVPKLSINFEEILLRAQRDSEGQNKVLYSYITIINYWIIINNAYYNYIIYG